MTYTDDRRDGVDTVVERTGHIATHDRNAPFFGPRDVAAGLVICIMVWGPLVAGAVLHH
jgi:hypothetical protein